MKTKALIVYLCRVRNITVKELAEKCGWFPQNLYNKISKDYLTIDDYEKIAEVTDSKFVYGFRKKPPSIL